MTVVRGCDIKVVCEHRHRPDLAKPRLLSEIVWQVDEELEAAIRADPSIPDDQAAMVITNDRFRYYGSRVNRKGNRVVHPNPELVVAEDRHDAAGALTAWRFICDACGLDRPVRIDRMDAWIETRLTEEPTRQRLTFEITD